MTKKTEISDADKTLFREAMRGVKPLTLSEKTTSKPPAKPRVKRKPASQTVIVSPFSDYEQLEPVGSEDLLEFHRSGIQHKMLRKLRSGQYNVEAILDLHGMNVAEASESLAIFLTQCYQQKVRHVLIIHGKGRSNNKPILKNKLNHWLRQTDLVLAFCSATASNGRGGALYVLLKGR
jgi:DNA-nicking Smr family endonuclease